MLGEIICICSTLTVSDICLSELCTNLYLLPGSVGVLQKGEIWTTRDREAATAQNQDFAELPENGERRGKTANS